MDHSPVLMTAKKSGFDDSPFQDNMVTSTSPDVYEFIESDFEDDFEMVITWKEETSQNGQLKGRIKSEHAQISQPQDLCASWSLSMNQLDSQYVSVKQHCPSPVLPQPKHLQVPQPLQFNQYPPPMLASPVPGDFANQYPMPTMTQFHTGQGCHQSITSGYEPAPKRMMMTPREKIEKLRKRQQMRAMLAIQRQQQQFGNQVLATMEGGNIEVEDNLCTTIPLADPHSPLEQNDSNTFGIAAEDHSMEQSVLNRLQDIISKLDMRIRLCIRDSLFRLAQSAAQRQHTSSTNKGSNESISSQEEINSNNSHYRIGRLPNVETETNPIDRIGIQMVEAKIWICIWVFLLLVLLMAWGASSHIAMTFFQGFLQSAILIFVPFIREQK